jgi:predicted dehydrogenase
MKKLKIAVIGAGHLGKYHADIYNSLKDSELVGVCDINKERADKIAKAYKISSYPNYKELIGKIDAATIAVPTKEHYAIAKDLIKNKIHLLIEKPITENLNQANELIRLAKENKVLLQVGHIERFNSAIRALTKIIKVPKFIECHRLGPFQPRGTDVGVVLDLMIHDIDIILHLVKSDIKELDAVGVKVLSNHEDIANVRLSFDNGAICNITASRISQERVRKIRIFQKNAYISLDYIQQEANIYTKKGKSIIEKNINIDKQNPLKEEIKSFIKCINSKKRPLVSGEEAKKALKVALKIIKEIHKKND